MNMVRRLRSHLEVHIRNHPTEGIHRCKVCNKRFVSENTLKIHMKKNHVVGKAFEKDVNVSEMYPKILHKVLIQSV